MSKREMLQSVLDDYNSHSCKQIELVWNDGKRSGIGNPKAIAAAMKALMEELRRQMEELDN